MLNAYESFATWWNSTIPPLWDTAVNKLENEILPWLQKNLISFFNEDIPKGIEVSKKEIREWSQKFLEFYVAIDTAFLTPFKEWLEVVLPASMDVAEQELETSKQNIREFAQGWLRGFEIMDGGFLTPLKEWLSVVLPASMEDTIQSWENLKLVITTFITGQLTWLDEKLGFLIENLVEVSGSLDTVYGWLTEVDSFIANNLLDTFLNADEALVRLRGFIGGVSGAVEWLIEKIEALIEWLSKIEIPGSLLGQSPSPFETSLRGIGDAIQELNTARLPQLATNLNATQIAGVQAGAAATYTTNNYLTVQSGQSTGSIVYDFNLMQAIAGGR
jgi:hypothetical protein